MGRIAAAAAALLTTLAATVAGAQTNPLGKLRPPAAPAASAASAAAPAPSRGNGLRISGRIDEATVQGLICGDLARPFGAVSPEVEGSWSFVPRSASAGSFTYKARNVGGVPGSGLGTYVITRDAGGGGRIKLDGTGSIHSPVGSFSATIFETLTLTPAPGC